MARAHEVAVPSDPMLYTGPLTYTRAFDRAEGGQLAVPADWAYGHVLAKSEALVLNGDALFAYNSPVPTAASRQDILSLRSALKDVTGVTCEGYTDFGGSVSHQDQLSAQRAQAICGLIHRFVGHVRTRSVGFGGSDPVVVGGSQLDRKANRRVVVLITKVMPVKRTAAVPSAVVLKKATAGDAKVVLSFMPARVADGGRVTGYQVSYDNGKTWHDLAISRSGGELQATVTGLTDGTEYSFEVRAVNGVGAGADSNTLDATPVSPTPIPPTPVVPSAVVLDTATGGDGQVTLSFSPPASDGGDAITSYQVSDDNGATWQTITTSSTGGGELQATVTGLTDGTEYPFEVRAVNGVGAGADSNTLDATPVSSLPGPPTLLSGIASVNWGTSDYYNVGFTFDPPASSGGSAIVGYQYSYTEVGDVNDNVGWTDFDYTSGSPDSGSFATDIDGCDDGKMQLTIRAVNADGDSVASNTEEVGLTNEC